jgi:alpha-N-arabinofuranosidase
MANIAQIANVLQSLILTDNEKMLTTPTYHVFDLYQPHKDATFLSSDLSSEEYVLKDKKISALSATVSKSADGSVHVSLVNVHPSKSISVSSVLKNLKVKTVTGRILTSGDIHDHNTFDQPNKVTTKEFKQFKLKGDQLTVEMPARSVVSLELK